MSATTATPSPFFWPTNQSASEVTSFSEFFRNAANVAARRARDEEKKESSQISSADWAYKAIIDDRNNDFARPLYLFFAARLEKELRKSYEAFRKAHLGFIVSGEFPYAAVETVTDEIKGFDRLLEGWDGDDAEPISKVAIDVALQFLHEVPYPHLPFAAFPDPDGSVGIQADLPDGRLLLSFGNNGKIAYFIRKDGEVSRGHDCTKVTIKKILADFL